MAVGSVHRETGGRHDDDANEATEQAVNRRRGLTESHRLRSRTVSARGPVGPQADAISGGAPTRSPPRKLTAYSSAVSTGRVPRALTGGGVVGIVPIASERARGEHSEVDVTSASQGTVQIVTDSTSDIKQEDAERAGITIVPAYVFFGEEQFRDGVTIGGGEFYRRLQQKGAFPKTAQPSPQDFADAFSALAPNGPVLALTCSSKMSGTYNSALIGRDMTLKDHPDAVIEVVDSLLVAMGLGVLTQGAAQKARDGMGIEELAEWARDTAGRTRIYFAVDTLEYLARGGRIGKAQRFLGGLLSVKPVLEFRDGEVHPLERVRSRAKAHALLESLALKSGTPEQIAYASTTDHDRALEMADRAKERLSLDDVPVFTIGAAVGTYAGPGCVGVAIVSSPGQ